MTGTLIDTRPPETRPPDRDLEQRMAALRVANIIRTYRKDLKRDLKAGRRTVVAVLSDPPAEVATMKVFDLLIAAPKIARVKANRLLTLARVSPSKTVAGISDRQRRELVRLITTRGWVR